HGQVGVVPQGHPVEDATHARLATSEEHDPEGIKRVSAAAGRLDPAAAEGMAFGRGDVGGEGGEVKGGHGGSARGGTAMVSSWRLKCNDSPLGRGLRLTFSGLATLGICNLKRIPQVLVSVGGVGQVATQVAQSPRTLRAPF